MSRIPSALFSLLLIGFFLPWVSVACSGEPLLTATGWQIVAGDAETADGGTLEDFTLADEALPDGSQHFPPALRVIAALTALCGLIGLALSLRGSAAGDRGALRTLGLFGAIPAAALLTVILFGEGWFHDAVEAAMTDASSELGEWLDVDDEIDLGLGLGLDWGGAAGRLAANQIDLVIEPGLWLSLIGSLGAALYAGLASAGRLPAAQGTPQQVPWPSYDTPNPRRQEPPSRPPATPASPPTPAAVRRCTRCGAIPARSQARYCGSCGSPLERQ